MFNDGNAKQQVLYCNVYLVSSRCKWELDEGCNGDVNITGVLLKEGGERY